MNGPKTKREHLVLIAGYLIEKLQPLYIQAAQAEHEVYNGIFGKQGKAQKMINSYSKILGLTADPLREINQLLRSGTLGDLKTFGLGLQEIYEAFISMTESRISVLRLYQQSGCKITPAVDATNRTSLQACGEFDAKFKKFYELADSQRKMVGIENGRIKIDPMF